jgi:hypothetical protein
MAFTMNTELIDHYSVFTSLVSKYGQPESLSPAEAVWENGDTRIIIERPLTVKYIDKQVFDAILAESQAKTATAVVLREAFLNEF